MKNWKFLLFIIIISVGCKKPYNPKVINAPSSYLVVEGVINTNDVTTIKLSRTVNLNSAVTTNPVNDATISVESDAGSSYGLTSSVAGTYTLSGTTLDNTRKYRIRIKTEDNKEYLSDFVQTMVTPPIDSIGFNLTGKGIQIYVNTHDPKNNTHYYRFDYSETWKFHSKYNSAFISNGVGILYRTPDQDIYTCFTGNTSSTILLGSSAKLKQDVIYQNPVIAIESTSEKIEIKYSILVDEYALTADAYKFWGNLKKNTEQLGSIFDAEPSEISGNIHNTANATEPVIGYISAGTVSSKRVFISNTQLPQSWYPTYPYSCELDSAWFHAPHTGENQVQDILVPFLALPVSAFFNGGPGPAGYLYSDSQCVDCTIRGTKQQPAFWQ